MLSLCSARNCASHFIDAVFFNAKKTNQNYKKLQLLSPFCSNENEV